jgi:hypothetical protein
MKARDNPMQRAGQEPLPLRRARRCGARTRNGSPCRSPAVREKRRCRMHGGAKGSGAPPGKRNGNYKHGQFTREALQERKTVTALLKALRANAAEIK